MNRFHSRLLRNPANVFYSDSAKRESETGSTAGFKDRSWSALRRHATYRVLTSVG